MKQFLSILFILVFSLPVFAGEISATSREELIVYLEDNRIKFDTPPVISDGRMLTPVREISEALGADVSWDGDSKVAAITLGNSTVSFTIGEKVMVVGERKMEIDAAADIIKDRTFVPMRALTEALGLEALWDDETRTAYLSLEKPLKKDYIIPNTYYVKSGTFEGCVIACKAMVLSNYFDKEYTFAEVLEQNGGGVYTNWGEEYSEGLAWRVILENELELKQETENWAESEFTVGEKLEMIASNIEDSSGIIAQFAKDSKTHGIVITGYTAEGELIVCDPDTKSEKPENTLIEDSCLADMFELYTTQELLPYLISMRMIEK